VEYRISELEANIEIKKKTELWKEYTRNQQLQKTKPENHRHWRRRGGNQRDM
jgi:hypothetical protein